MPVKKITQSLSLSFKISGSPNKYQRVHRADSTHQNSAKPRTRTAVKPFSSELVGTECVLGHSYNVQKKYIGRRAVVLGTQMASGGWVDIYILKDDGTADKRLRWRFQGLHKLTGDQQPTASKSSLAQFVKQYNNNSKV